MIRARSRSFPCKGTAALIAAVLALGIVATPGNLHARAQQSTPTPSPTPPKPLTNADIVMMVKKQLPASTIVAAMRANPINFDVSVDGLLALHEAGVNQKIMDAMVAAVERQNRTAKPATTTKPGSTSLVRAPGTTPTSAGQPTVMMLDGENKLAVPVERTRLTQAKEKPKSLGAAAKSTAIDTAIRTGVQEASKAVGNMGGSAIGQAGGIGQAMMKSDTKTVGYIWALPGVTSQTVVPNTAPSFEVSLGKVLGVNPAEYEPTIVILTPTPKEWRLVGASEGKERVSSTATMDWPLYSGFVEDRVPVTASPLESGAWRVTPTRPLPPGEYAVVFRPLSNSKKFRGLDVARNQGDGLMFNSVWAFSVR